MRKSCNSVIIRIICSAMIPFIQLFALYVIMHGHYGPGGGFQGGAILGVSIILQRLYLGQEVSYKKFPPHLATMFGAIGMLIYIVVGLAPMLTGAMFLDYGQLPIPGISGPPLRALGILIVEVGIGLSVCGTMVLIYDSLMGDEKQC